MRRVALAGAFLCLASNGYASDAPSIVKETAERHGVPVPLALAVARTESRFNCRARGSVGERGLMQVRPATARAMGVHGNLYDCRVGAEAGVRYLRAALDRSGGDWGWAARLYNAGLGASRKVTSYVRKVLGAAR